MAKKSLPKVAPAAGIQRLSAPTGIVATCFVLALVMRLLFWQATPDASWPHSAYYQGDAPLWLEYAYALDNDLAFEQGLPLRPPGNGYLIAALWDGQTSSIATLKLIWCVLGATAVALFARLALSHFGLIAGALTGLILACARPLLLLSTSLNNETPYLVLVATSLLLWPKAQDTTLRRGLFGAAIGLATLFRVEHLLFLVGALALIVWQARARPGRDLLRVPVPALAGFILVILPWQLEAMAASRRFNDVEPILPPATAQSLAQNEQGLAFMHWHDDAVAERARLPAFIRRTASNFVAATVAWRGGQEVRGSDFAILEQAFGAPVAPISERPLIALYGGLNFLLANHADARGGFSRVALDRKPPLAGGIESYPPTFVYGLPPNGLAFTYPPHLAAVNHGYSQAWTWIGAEPAAFLRLEARKLALFAAGWQGLGGPGRGFVGLRRPVDLTISASPWAWTWPALLVVAALWGLASGAQRDLKMPILLAFAVPLVAALAFFGYARLGATALPALVILASAGLATFLGRFRQKHLVAVALTLALVLLGREVWRTSQNLTPFLDARSTAAGDPFPPDLHEDRRVELR